MIKIKYLFIFIHHYSKISYNGKTLTIFFIRYYIK